MILNGQEAISTPNSRPEKTLFSLCVLGTGGDAVVALVDTRTCRCSLDALSPTAQSDNRMAFAAEQFGTAMFSESFRSLHIQHVPGVQQWSSAITTGFLVFLPLLSSRGLLLFYGGTFAFIIVAHTVRLFFKLATITFGTMTRGRHPQRNSTSDGWISYVVPVYLPIIVY